MKLLLVFLFPFLVLAQSNTTLPVNSKLFVYYMPPGTNTWLKFGQVVVDSANITKDTTGTYHVSTPVPAPTPVPTPTPTLTTLERYTCEGSGLTWNCAGLQLLKITLPDGTKLGPWVIIPPTDPTIAADPKWKPIAANAIP